MTIVFISYASSDSGAAANVDALERAFKERGWTSWIDRDKLRAGDHIRERIREATRDCQACVVVVPETGQVTTWMTWEIEAFLAHGKRVLVLDPWMGSRSITGLPEDLIHRRMESDPAPILLRLDELLGSKRAARPNEEHRRQQFARHALAEVQDLADRGAYAQLLRLGPELQRHFWLILQFEEMVAVAALVKHAADQRGPAESRDPTLDDLEKEMIAQTDGVGWGRVMLGQFDAANEALEVAAVSLDELRSRQSAKVPYWATKVLRHRGALLVHQAYREADPRAREFLLRSALAKLSEAERSAAEIPDAAGGSDSSPGLGGRQDMLSGIDHDLALAHIALGAFDDARTPIGRLDRIAHQWSADKSCRVPLLRAWLAQRQSAVGPTEVQKHHRRRALNEYRVAIAQARTAARWDIALWGCAGAATLADTADDRDKFKSHYQLIREEWVASDTVHDAMLHRGPVVGLRDV